MDLIYMILIIIIDKTNIKYKCSQCNTALKNYFVFSYK